MIDYKKLLKQNMIGVFKDILINIKDKGLSNGNHLYITFITKHESVRIPKWLQEKYSEEMTIVIQYEYYNIKVEKNFFNISLSFNGVKTDLTIGYESIISFADPSANFGLILKSNKIKDKVESIDYEPKEGNVLNFSNYKKN